MCKSIGQRSLDQQLRSITKRSTRRKNPIKRSKSIEETTDFRVPVARSLRSPEILAFSHADSPSHEIGHVRDDLHGYASLRSSREFGKARRDIAQYFSCSIRQCSHKVPQECYVSDHKFQL